MSRIDDIRARKRERENQDRKRKAREMVEKALDDGSAEINSEEELERVLQEEDTPDFGSLKDIPAPNDTVAGSLPEGLGGAISRPVTAVPHDAIQDNYSLVTEEQKESDTAKAISAIMGKDDIRMQSELDKDEVRALTVLDEISKRFSSTVMKQKVENWLAFMVSHERGSRREVVDAFSGLDEHGRHRGGLPAGMSNIPPLRLQ